MGAALLQLSGLCSQHFTKGARDLSLHLAVHVNSLLDLWAPVQLSLSALEAELKKLAMVSLLLRDKSSLLGLIIEVHLLVDIAHIVGCDVSPFTITIPIACA
jgi:hypothetical protein